MVNKELIKNLADSMRASGYSNSDIEDFLIKNGVVRIEPGGKMVATGRIVQAPTPENVELEGLERLSVAPKTSTEFGVKSAWKFYSSDIGRYVDWTMSKASQIMSPFPVEIEPTARQLELRDEYEKDYEHFREVMPGGRFWDGVWAFGSEVVFDPVNLIGMGSFRAAEKAVSKLTQSKIPLLSKLGKKISMLAESYSPATHAGDEVAEVIAGNLLVGSSSSEVPKILIPQKSLGKGTKVFDESGNEFGKLLEKIDSSVPDNTSIKVLVTGEVEEGLSLGSLTNKQGGSLTRKRKQHKVREPKAHIADDADLTRKFEVGDTLHPEFPSPDKPIEFQFGTPPKGRPKTEIPIGTDVYKKLDSGKVKKVGTLAENVDPFVSPETVVKVSTKKTREVTRPIGSLHYENKKLGRIQLNHFYKVSEARFAGKNHKIVARDLGLSPVPEQEIIPAEEFLLSNPDWWLSKLARNTRKRFGVLFSKNISFPQAAFDYERGSPPYKFLVQEFGQMFDQHAGFKDVAMRRLSRNSLKLENAMNKYANRTGMDIAEVSQMIREHRETATINQLPKMLRNVVNKSVNQIDELSNRFIHVYSSSGLPAEEILTKVDTLTANLEQYLHLRYGKHMTEDWWKTIEGTGTLDNYLDYLRNLYDGQGKTEAWLLAEAYRTLSREGGGFLIPFVPKSSKNVRQILTEMKERKKLTPALKAAMGMVEDSRLGIQQTASIMIHDLEVTAFKRRAMEKALERGLLSKEPTGKHIAKIGLSTIDRSFYGSHETNKFFQEVFQEIRDRPSVFKVANGFIKAGKVLLSPRTHIRNFMSASISATVQGVHAAPITFARALKASLGVNVREEFRAFPQFEKTISKMFGDIKVFDAIVEDAVRENLFRQGAHVGEAQKYLSAVKGYMSSDPGFLKIISGKGGNTLAADNIEMVGEIPKFRKFISDFISAKGFATALYNVEDDLVKTAVWLHRQSEWKWALGLKPGKDLSSLPPETLSKIANAYGEPSARSISSLAANQTKETMQHYAHTARLSKAMSSNLAFAPFVTFQFEMPRNLYNLVRQIGIDLDLAKEISPKFYALAASKIVGLSRGITLMRSIKNRHNYEVNSEDEETFKKYMALPWDRHGALVFVDRDGPKIMYRNISFMDPYANVSEALETLISGGFSPEAVQESLQQIAETYVSLEPILKNALEVGLNRRIHSDAISEIFAEGQISQGGDIDPSLAKRAARAAGNLAPTVFIDAKKTAQRISEDDEHWWAEIDSYVRPRLITIDMRDTMAAHLRNLQEKMRGLSDLPERDAEIRWKKYNEEAVKMVRAYKNHGMTFEWFNEAATGKSEFAKVKFNKRLAGILWGESEVPYAAVRTRERGE